MRARISRRRARQGRRGAEAAAGDDREARRGGRRERLPLPRRAHLRPGRRARAGLRRAAREARPLAAAQDEVGRLRRRGHPGRVRAGVQALQRGDRRRHGRHRPARPAAVGGRPDRQLPERAARPAVGQPEVHDHARRRRGKPLASIDLASTCGSTRSSGRPAARDEDAPQDAQRGRRRPDDGAAPTTREAAEPDSEQSGSGEVAGSSSRTSSPRQGLPVAGAAQRPPRRVRRVDGTAPASQPCSSP